MNERTPAEMAKKIQRESTGNSLNITVSDEGQVLIAAKSQDGSVGYVLVSTIREAQDTLRAMIADLEKHRAFALGGK